MRSSRPSSGRRSREFTSACWSINLIAIVLVFSICRRILDAQAAAAAAVAYALLSLSPWTLGFAGHATHFVVVFALAAILCLQRAFDRRRLSLYFGAGVFAGLAPLMKQPGLVFTAFVLAIWAWCEMNSASREPSKLPDWRQRVSRGATLIAGILTPFIVLFASLVATHTWNAFWLWTVSLCPLLRRAPQREGVPHVLGWIQARVG